MKIIILLGFTYLFLWHMNRGLVYLCMTVSLPMQILAILLALVISQHYRNLMILKGSAISHLPRARYGLYEALHACFEIEPPTPPSGPHPTPPQIKVWLCC